MQLSNRLSFKFFFLNERYFTQIFMVKIGHSYLPLKSL